MFLKKKTLVGRRAIIALGLAGLAVRALVAFGPAFRTGSSETVGDDTRRVDELFASHDPIARNLILISGYVETYRWFRGRFATSAQIPEEGLWFFEPRNPFTGTPLANSCERPAPGHYDIKVSSPYTLEKLVFYDRDGNEIFYPALRSRTIRVDNRDKPLSGVFATFLQLQPSDQQMKAFFLGRLMNYILWRLPEARGENGDGFVFLFAQPPFNRLNDTLTGQTLSFDGTGYGDRLKFTRSGNGTWFITIYLPDGSVGYREEVNLVAKNESGTIYSAVREPPLGSGEEEPEFF